MRAQQITKTTNSQMVTVISGWKMMRQVSQIQNKSKMTKRRKKSRRGNSKQKMLFVTTFNARELTL